MEQPIRISGWQQARGMAMESLCLLWRLIPLALQLLWLQQDLPQPHTMLLPLGAAVVQGLFLSPWRLSRVSFYCHTAAGAGLSRTPLAAGWRLWGQAVAWRWHLWWRRAVVFVLSGFPAAALWVWGTRTSNPILWLPLGAAAWLLGLAIGAGLLCRYAVAPLLVLRGCPAGAAMGLSARLMRGHLREYINFLGRWAGRLAACLTLIPIPWVLPRFRTAQAALLTAYADSL